MTAGTPPSVFLPQMPHHCCVNKQVGGHDPPLRVLVGAGGGNTSTAPTHSPTALLPEARAGGHCPHCLPASRPPHPPRLSGEPALYESLLTLPVPPGTPATLPPSLRPPPDFHARGALTTHLRDSLSDGSSFQVEAVLGLEPCLPTGSPVTWQALSKALAWPSLPLGPQLIPGEEKMTQCPRSVLFLGGHRGRKGGTFWVAG